MLLYRLLVYKSRGAFCACGLRISTSLARFCSLIVAISVAPFAAAKGQMHKRPTNFASSTAGGAPTKHYRRWPYSPLSPRKAIDKAIKHKLLRLQYARYFVYAHERKPFFS